VADGERAQRELGFVPRYSSRDAVLAYVSTRSPALPHRTRRPAREGGGEGRAGRRDASGRRRGAGAAGRPGLDVDAAARLWSRLYFAWHSNEVDEFGYDPKFTETILPFSRVPVHGVVAGRSGRRP
jgi:hypothetical protein